MESSVRTLLDTRFACKHFDTTKKIDAAVLHDLLDAARVSPSSYGLQAWKFVVVTNPELKAVLAPAAYGQPQMTESDALVFFCARTDLMGDDGLIAKYMTKYQQDMGVTPEQTEGFKAMLTGSVTGKTADEVKTWTQKQVYLPAMTLMLAAKEQGIDSCPMEGFDPAKVAEILGLDASTVPTLLVALGYKNMEKPTKSRFTFEDVVEIRA